MNGAKERSEWLEVIKRMFGKYCEFKIENRNIKQDVKLQEVTFVDAAKDKEAVYSVENNFEKNKIAQEE